MSENTFTAGCQAATEAHVARVAELEARIRELEAERNAIKAALEQSVQLQSHYAILLNMEDGGKRAVFKNADEWLDHIRALGVNL